MEAHHPHSKRRGYACSQIVDYAATPEQYYSFITPEAYLALQEWMDFRSSYGEKITGNSWVMRDVGKATNITYGAKFGYANLL